MRKLEGLSASRGLVVGPVFCFADLTPITIRRYAVSPEDLPAQWTRFERALERSRAEINVLKDERSKEQSEILDAQLLMLEDPEFIPQVRRFFETERVNVEFALKAKVDESAQLLRSTGDAYLSERAVDIEDAFGRVLGHLLREGQGTGTGQGFGDGAGDRPGTSTSRFIPPGSILVARNIKPSEAMSLRDSGIAGIVLEEGGSTSHVAILARAWHIPAVMGARGILAMVSDGDELILDAVDGLVIASPTKDALSAYRSRMDLLARQDAASAAGHSALVLAASETADGVPLSLAANIASAAESADALAEGASGIGLFRSEFLFLGADDSPEEDAQFDAYREAVESMAGAPVVIRTLDSGADKMVGEQLDLAEKNPLLGWRAVRYCLDRPELFNAQLRALLRASYFGDLRIMFPMISCVEELDAALEALDTAKRECLRDELPFNRDVKVGAMIEIPSAAVCADLIAKKVDFLSIGTNDLTQYTMAVDRENPKVAHLYDYYNPAVLRLVQRTIEAGAKAGVEVSMCGEMAGDPAGAILLVGLGLRHFSMNVSSLTRVKALARKVTLSEARELAAAAMELSTAREIRKLVQERVKAYDYE